MGESGPQNTGGFTQHDPLTAERSGVNRDESGLDDSKGPVLLAQAESTPGGESSSGDSQDLSFSQAWSAQISDLEMLAEDTALLEEQVKKEAQPLGETLKNLQADSRRILGLFQASRSHPTQQLPLFMQLQNLKRGLDKHIQPLDLISSSIHQRLQELDALGKDLSEADTGASQEQAEFVSKLTATQKRLSNSIKQVDKVLVPAKGVQEKLATTLQTMQESLLDNWRNFYFTPSGQGMDSYISTFDLLRNWASSLPTRMGFAYPQDADAWQTAGLNFLGSAAVLGLIGYLCLIGTKRLPQRWSKSCGEIIKSSWLWITVGASLLTASHADQGSNYFALIILGVFVIVWGISSLTGRLRGTAKREAEGLPSILFAMYIPAALGVFMLFSGLPGRVLGIMWVIITAFFLFRMLSIRRIYWAKDAPNLELVSIVCIFIFGMLSLFAALLGYARLAILLYMLLFAIINTVILASALTTLAHILANQLLDKKTAPILHALLDAIFVPLSWLVSLLCTIPWFWAMPGSNYILRYAMETRYDVGEASFNFSKIILIVALFFLFKSFIKLGKTSLNQLPGRIPNVEKGVIPPLKSLLTYGLWAIFALVILNLLGVSLTSLAVIAGGLSVGIGFGMQTIFNNLVSGIMIIFERTLLVGDYIEVGGTAGTVREVNIRSTVIETPERALVTIPNSALMTGQFINWTRETRTVRRSIIVGVAYGTDVAKAMRLLLEAADKNNNVTGTPAVLFNDFGASSMDFQLNVFINDFDNVAKAVTDLRVEIEKSFRENNIEMPFPQLDVHFPDQATPEEGKEEAQQEEAQPATGGKS